MRQALPLAFHPQNKKIETQKATNVAFLSFDRRKTAAYIFSHSLGRGPICQSAEPLCHRKGAYTVAPLEILCARFRMGVFPNAITACTPNYCMRLKSISSDTSVIQHSSLPSCSMPACKHGTGTFYSSSSMRRLCVSIFASCSYCGNSLFMRASFSLPTPLSSYSSTMTVSSMRKRFY